MPTTFNKLSRNRCTDSLPHIIAQDILNLLNCALRSANLRLSEDSPASTSVINYGNSPWFAMGKSRIDPFVIAQDIHKSIVKFEPRLVPSTVKVKTRLETYQTTRQDLYFDIEGNITSEALLFKMLLAFDYQGASFILTEYGQ